MCDSVGVCVGAYFIYIIYMIPRYMLKSCEKYKWQENKIKKIYTNSLNIHTTLINNNKINDKKKLNMYAKLKNNEMQMQNMLLLKIITRN